MEATIPSQVLSSPSRTAQHELSNGHVELRRGLETSEIASFMQFLSHQGLRQLKQAAMQIDFSCDIIGKIPLEIMSMVFQHLPIYQCFQARRVSRCWSEKLLSRQILEARLHQWYREDDFRDQTIARMAEKIDAYQQISPSSMAILDLR